MIYMYMYSSNHIHITKKDTTIYIYVICSKIPRESNNLQETAIGSSHVFVTEWSGTANSMDAKTVNSIDASCTESNHITWWILFRSKSSKGVHPRNLTWYMKIGTWKKRFPILQTLRECKYSALSLERIAEASLLAKVYAAQLWNTTCISAPINPTSRPDEGATCKCHEIPIEIFGYCCDLNCHRHVPNAETCDLAGRLAGQGVFWAWLLGDSSGGRALEGRFLLKLYDSMIHWWYKVNSVYTPEI